MTRKWTRVAALVTAGMIMTAAAARAGDPTASLKQGKPDLKSAGPLAFGPDGILFVGDTQGAALFAIDTGDRGRRREDAPVKVKDLAAKVAALLGTEPQQVMINDLAVNPISGNAYLSVSRGRGPDATPVILRVGGRRQARRAAARERPVRQGRDPQRARRRRPGSSGQPLAERVDHRPRLRRRPRLPRRPVERGVLLPADRDPVPVQRGLRRRGDRDLPRRPRPVRDQVAGPHLRAPTRSRASPTCWPPTPARRWSRSRSPTSRPAPTSRGRPSPSWATATGRST